MGFGDLFDMINPFNKEEEVLEGGKNSTNQDIEEDEDTVRAEHSDDPILKLKQEIERMEFRKKSVLTVFEHERNQLISLKTEKFEEIGRLAYDLHKKNKSKYDFSKQFQGLKDLDAKIEEKEKQTETFSKRYDEEIAVLTANVTLQETPKNQIEHSNGLSISMTLCENCNELVVKHRFCSACGMEMGESESIQSSIHEKGAKETSYLPFRVKS